jgi:biotin transport system substrate-specific component
MKTRNLILTGLFAALTAIGAFLKVPVGASSFTLQVLFTCLAGVLLGANYGALSQLVYVLLGLIGLPIFTAGGGPAYVLQPTFGFLLGLIPMAWVVGKLAGDGMKPVRVAGACVAGLAVLYLVGMPYMALILNVYLGKGLSLSALLWAGMLPFLPFDALKIVVTALVSAPLCKALRRTDAGRTAGTFS